MRTILLAGLIVGFCTSCGDRTERGAVPRQEVEETLVQCMESVTELEEIQAQFHSFVHEGSRWQEHVGLRELRTEQYLGRTALGLEVEPPNGELEWLLISLAKQRDCATGIQCRGEGRIDVGLDRYDGALYQDLSTAERDALVWYIDGGIDALVRVTGWEGSVRGLPRRSSRN